jgi:hypothetical protein
MLREPHATKGSGATPSRVRYRPAMDPKKHWDLRFVSYLQPGVDFTVFELDEQVGRCSCPTRVHGHCSQSGS